MTERTEVTEEAGGPDDPFFEVPVQSLYPGNLVPFRLYTRIQGQQLQYRENGLVLDAKHLAFLRRSSITSLWIPRESIPEYLTFILDLSKSGSDEPAEILRFGYLAACSAARLAFEDPTSEEVVAALCTVIESVDDAIGRGGNSFTMLQETLARSPDLYEHSVNVCFLGLLLAHQLELPDLPDFAMGLLFHDVGKLDLPASLLERSEPLNVEEALLVRQHPANGLARISSAPFATPLVRDVVYRHHERLDGSGYPDGLASTDLSPAVRVASIVNDFERRTSHRPFHRGKPSYEVAKQMLTEQAAWYDQAYLSTFVRCLSS